MEEKSDINSSLLLFVDTWGWCAMINAKEKQHEQVKQVINGLLGPQILCLMKLRVHHRASIELHQEIEQLIAGKLLEVIYITYEIEQTTWRLFERYSDKDFSFTDCTSFVVMQLLGLSYALTNDHHFEQMEFGILP